MHKDSIALPAQLRFCMGLLLLGPADEFEKKNDDTRSDSEP